MWLLFATVVVQATDAVAPSNEKLPETSPDKLTVTALANFFAELTLVTQVASLSAVLIFARTAPAAPPFGRLGVSSSKKNNCPSKEFAVAGNAVPYITFAVKPKAPVNFLVEPALKGNKFAPEIVTVSLEAFALTEILLAQGN